MPLSPYDPCVCGSGKKVKFCCPKTALNEVEKIVKAIEGDQRIAACDSLTRLIEKYPDSLCLLSLKAQTQLSLNDTGAFVKTVERIREVAPNDPMGQTFDSVRACVTGDLKEAIARLQDALAKLSADEEEADYVALAARLIRDTAMYLEQPMVGYIHGVIAAKYSQDERDQSYISSLDRNEEQVPAPLKFHSFVNVQEDHPNREDFEKIARVVRNGAFRRASALMSSLGSAVVNEPGFISMEAYCQAAQGFNEEAAIQYRRIATLTTADEFDRLNCEAIAQILTGDNRSASIDIAEVEWEIDDSQSVVQLLRDNPHFREQRVPEPESDQPPALASFILFNQQLEEKKKFDPDKPEEFPKIDFSMRPKAIGSVLVFGRESDREARVEYEYIVSDKDPSDPIAKQLGDKLTKRNADEVVPENLHDAALTPTQYYHEDLVATYSHQLEFQRQVTDYIIKEWSEVPMKCLEEKTPIQAAEENPNSIPLKAAAILFERRLDSYRFEPTAGPLEFLKLSIEDRKAEGSELLYNGLSVPYFVGETKEQIGTLFVLSANYGIIRGIVRHGNAMLEQDVPADEKASVAQVVIRCTPPSQVLDAIEKAYGYLKAAEQSVAGLLLQELEQRILRLERDRCEEIVNEVSSNHIEEPGVAEALYSILRRFGLVRDEDLNQMNMPEPALAGSPAAATPEKIWTPDQGAASAAPAPSSESKKSESKLWLPGDG